MTKLVMLRHGQSTWNSENRFTGWTDVDLTEMGKREAQEAGKILLKEGFDFDMAYTSVLKRAIRTLWIVLDEIDQMWIPVERSWKLNERHYGALQGLDKAETAAKYGDNQVKIWRRSYDILPPLLAQEDERHPRFEKKYYGLQDSELPSAESLKTTLERVLPYWESNIFSHIKRGKKVLIVAHGNSLRALVKHLSDISEEEVLELNIPTGIPLVYDFDNAFKPVNHYYLGDQMAINTAIKAVAEQGKIRKQ